VDHDTLKRLDRSRAYLAACYDLPVSLEEAAREACLSPFHYHRLFVAAFGETPHAFLTRRRMEGARQLLIAGDLPVTEVCLAVGYSSLGTFSARFHRVFGCSPSAYRREARRFYYLGAVPPLRFVPMCFAGRWDGKWVDGEMRDRARRGLSFPH
jgi:AraC-like DNA-binding protein